MPPSPSDPLPSSLQAAWVRPGSAPEGGAAAVSTLFRLLGLPLSRTRVRRAFRAHARPASLGAVMEALAGFGLEAAPLRVPAERLPELPLPALVGIREGQGEGYAVLCGVSEAGPTLLDGQGPRTLGWEAYGTLATGLAVAVAVPGSAAFPGPLRYRAEEALEDLREGLRRQGSRIALAALAALLGWAAWGAGWEHRAASVLVLAGWGLSVGMAEGSLGAGGVLARICRRSGRFDCASVLGAPEARLGGRIPYAHLAVGFYGALALLLAAAGLRPALAPAAWVLAAAGTGASLAAAVHLVRLQALVLKRWCLGCMACHGLNAGLAALALAVLARGGVHASPAHLAVLGLGALGVALLCLAFYGLRALKASLDAVERRWKSLTGDRNVLLAAFHGAAPVSAVAPAVAGEGTGMELVFFSQPFCPHCTRVHQAVARIAARFAGLRPVVRLLVDEAPARGEDFLDADRPIRAAEMGLLLYALEAVRGPEAFHAALGQVLAAQAEFRSLRPPAVLGRLGLAAAELRPGLDAAREGLRRDALLAARAGVAGTPSLFLDRRPVPEWAAPEQVALLAESLWGARPA